MKSKKSYINFPENNHILWLPPEAHSVTLNTAIKLYSEIVKGFEIKTFCRTIEEIKNVKLALEFANLAIKRLKEVKTQKKLLECILKNYNYEELKNHELFKDYEFSEYGSLMSPFGDQKSLAFRRREDIMKLL
ncbi:MAG: hypothetical protein ACIPMY_05025 [Rickettsia endosymbiont of Pentastiridius leporinus]